MEDSSTVMFGFCLARNVTDRRAEMAIDSSTPAGEGEVRRAARACASLRKSIAIFGMRYGRENAADQDEQAWRDADAAYAAGRYRSQQREHRGHHKKKFHANPLFSEHSLGHAGTRFRSVQRIPVH